MQPRRGSAPLEFMKDGRAGIGFAEEVDDRFTNLVVAIKELDVGDRTFAVDVLEGPTCHGHIGCGRIR